MNTPRLVAAAGLSALLLAPAAATAADSYAFTITQATSTASYNASASAPFTGTMTGDTTATPPTRLKHGTGVIFVSCGTFTSTTNEAINVSGTIAASGSNNNLHPTGSFTLTIDTAAGTAALRSLSLDLLGGATATIAANLNNFRYETFCSVNPSCSQAFLTPISLPLGNVTISAVTATQTGSTPATGTLTPGSTPGTYNFSIDVTVDVNAAASFQGAPLAVPTQAVPITFNGTVTPSGSTAAETSNISISLMPPTDTTPNVLPPMAFTTPTGIPLVCGGLNLLLGLTVTSNTFSLSSSSTLNASGTRLLCACDWNNSGAVTVQDVFDFLGSYFGGSADFNHSGSTTIQDIFDFLACYFSRQFPC